MANKRYSLSEQEEALLLFALLGGVMGLSEENKYSLTTEEMEIGATLTDNVEILIDKHFQMNYTAIKDGMFKLMKKLNKKGRKHAPSKTAAH